MSSRSKPSWLKQAVTDYDNQTFDTGRIISCVSVLAMIGLSAFDVIINHRPFDPQGLGFGLAAACGGLGVYLMGDNRRPPPTTGGESIPIERG